MKESSLKKKLSKEEYHVLREKGTEPPFSGEYVEHFEDGFYHCKACGEKLFSSEKKFKSHDGWPSFSKAENVTTKMDFSHGMIRMAVSCKKCDSHLGHVFPNLIHGKKYCINSVCLTFSKHEKHK